MTAPPGHDAHERGDAVVQHRAGRRRDETERVEGGSAPPHDDPPSAGRRVPCAAIARRAIAGLAGELGDEAASAVSVHDRVPHPGELRRDESLQARASAERLSVSSVNATSTKSSPHFRQA
jgi:hypothetical protein